MFGYARNNTLVSVMRIQELRRVTLIRHAYALTDYQRIGIGKSLLQYLFLRSTKVLGCFSARGRMRPGQLAFI